MLNEDDRLVQFKLGILKRAMPSRSAIVFGDMYIVEGGFSQKCLEYGCENVLLIDTLETPSFLRTRLENPALNFYKGDFSNPFFMKSITETAEIGVVFDILLHQAPLINTIHMMLEHIEKSILIVQPMLREQGLRNTLVYLPGCSSDDEIYPLGPTISDEFKLFDPTQVNQSHWIWAMTRTFLESVLIGEGFEITWDAELGDLPNSKWYWWGGIAERRRTPNPSHWSQARPGPVLYSDHSWSG